jgi:hypothetical protein
MKSHSKNVTIVVTIPPDTASASPSSREQDDVCLQPWFLPKPVALEIRKILPSIHLAKMRYYFDDYGCLRCQKRGVLYGSNGFCESCCKIVRDRVSRSLEKRLRSVGVSGSQVALESNDDPVSSAREIISRKASEE